MGFLEQKKQDTVNGNWDQSFEDQKKAHVADTLMKAKALGMDFVPKNTAPQDSLAEWAAIQDMIKKNQVYQADKQTVDNNSSLKGYMPITNGEDSDIGAVLNGLNELSRAEAGVNRYEKGIDPRLAEQWLRYSK